MMMQQQFLISLPTLVDSNFSKSLVYVDSHDGDGAKGWIVNKELDNRISVRLRKSIQLALNAPIYYGGPVEVNQAFVLHSDDVKIKQTVQLNDNLCVTRDESIINMLNEGNYPEYWRIVIGCCSWGAGQLESEMLGSRTNGKGLWINCPYDQQLMWQVLAENQWEKGIEYSATKKVADYLNF